MQFQAFQSIVAVEAFSREAVMMSALQEFGGQGLKNLTPGDLYGSAKHWSKKARLEMGIYFLLKTFGMFMLDSPSSRETRRCDLKIPINANAFDQD